MTDGPLVSVIVPTFNRAHLIGRALRSVLSQSYGQLELLVVDDASTDDTAGVIAAMEDPRVRYLRQPANQGPGAARNAGMRAARGALIALLDSDDEWLPGKLERQVALLTGSPARTGLVYTGVEVVGSDGTVQRCVPSARGRVYAQLLEENVIYGGTLSALLRRAVVERVGGFDEQLPAIEDHDYWLRVAEHFEVDFVPDVLVRYHDAAPAGRVSRALDRNLRAREMFYRKHQEAMARAGVAHRFLAQSAGRHLKRSHWEPQRGRALVRMALAERPRSLALYPLLAKSYIPTPVFRALVRMTERSPSA